jgi:PhzF family phenazine biosynthesis protein
LLRIPIYQIDAFCCGPFSGNPAAVCLLPRWLPDRLLQAIASENNLSETAFFVPAETHLHLRWFTPVSEVDLCGHATLAAAFVYLNFIDAQAATVSFQSQSGPLQVERCEEGLLALDFPSRPPDACELPTGLLGLLAGDEVEFCGKARDLMLVLPAAEDVLNFQPDDAVLAELPFTGIIVTARGRDVDFVSRFFAPREGISEDPVTGSAHSTLIPYWAERLNRNQLMAKQLSARGGELHCQWRGDRVGIGGRVNLFLRGEINLREGDIRLFEQDKK